MLEKNPEFRQNKNSKPNGKKETESINAMTTFEFTNQGVDRHYDEPEVLQLLL